MKYTKEKTKKANGFYIVLAVCLLAVGAAAFFAVKETLPSSEKPAPETVKSELNNENQEAEDVTKTVSDQPDTRAQEAEDPQEQKTEVSYVMPVKGNIGKIYSDSCLQYSRTYGDMRLHLGVDIEAAVGSEVVATAGGRVVAVLEDELLGNTVSIDHGDGVVLSYCGLSNLTVEENETVSAGLKIGEIGYIPSECDDPPHLHLYATKNEEYFSPLELLTANK